MSTVLALSSTLNVGVSLKPNIMVFQVCLPLQANCTVALVLGYNFNGKLEPGMQI
jgi:hypothetical protein